MGSFRHKRKEKRKEKENRKREENFSSSPNSGHFLSTNLYLPGPHQWHPKSNSSRREERNQPNACTRPRWSSFLDEARPSFFRTKMALALFSLSVIALLFLAFLGFLIYISVCAIIVFSLLVFLNFTDGK